MIVKKLIQLVFVASTCAAFSDILIKPYEVVSQFIKPANICCYTSRAKQVPNVI